MRKCKFKFYSALLILIFTSVLFYGCGGNKTTDKTVTTVRLNEVTRSVFYAPMYVALSQGFFTEEGLKIDLTTGEGADATVLKTQVLYLIHIAMSPVSNFPLHFNSKRTKALGIKDFLLYQNYSLLT